MNHLLDLSMYRCPIPLLMTKRAISLLAPNEKLHLTLHGDAVLQDFISLCNEQNCQISIQPKDKEDKDKIILFISKNI